MPENYEARSSFKDLIFSPISELTAGKAVTIRQRENSQRVRIQIESGRDSSYLLFLNDRKNQFPIAGRGNFIIKRASGDGKFIQIKVFIRNNPGCFIRLFPLSGGKRSVMDVFLFGVPVYKQVVLPVDFQVFLTAPMSRIMEMSAPTVDWKLLLYDGDDESDRKARDLVEKIREFLPFLPDAEDGALDAEGRLVFIRDGSFQVETSTDTAGHTGTLSPPEAGLNCSGFTKWVVDGLYFPLMGRYLDISALKKKHILYRGNRWSARYEQERDPYFGLDWSRNLAAELLEAQNGEPTVDPQTADVRETAFLRYTEDVGYPIDELGLLLYLESRQNPGHFYIGSINHEYGSKPVLRQHFHLVVLFPHFSGNGSFQVIVFSRNQEMSLSEFKKIYRNDFIHLVRLRTWGEFTPQVPATP